MAIISGWVTFHHAVSAPPGGSWRGGAGVVGGTEPSDMSSLASGGASTDKDTPAGNPLAARAAATCCESASTDDRFPAADSASSTRLADWPASSSKGSLTRNSTTSEPSARLTRVTLSAVMARVSAVISSFWTALVVNSASAALMAVCSSFVASASVRLDRLTVAP
eukprot:scaffold3774_cov40-Prasinocladus_malaysianus.AAC.1